MPPPQIAARGDERHLREADLEMLDRVREGVKGGGDAGLLMI